jgi:hypothetical protein
MDPFIIRNYRKGDEEGITSLFKDVFRNEMTVDQWRWKYFIPGSGKIYSKVVENAAGHIIGHAGAIPLRGSFQNKPVQFFQIADVMVHAGARGFLGRKNVFEVMMKSLFEGINNEFPDVFCYGFPGRRPFLLGKRVGVYEEVEGALDCVKYSRPSLLNPYKIKPLRWDDRRLNDIWSSLSKDFPLAVIRDRDYLRWRYAGNPFFSYELLGGFLFGRLKGWLVIKDSGEEVFVVDQLIEKNRCGNILTAFQKYLLPRGKKAFRMWVSEDWRRNIKDCRLEKTPVVVTNMVWKLPYTTCVVRKNLYYTMGDTDIF